VLYRLHPWAGREVFVHAVVDRAEAVFFRCTLDGSEDERWREIRPGCSIASPALGTFIS
jgi:hypothetical protein